MKKTVLEVDLNSLEHNLNLISKKLKPSTKIMAVVKANAYGSSSVEIAKKLVSLNIDYFAVAFASEGIKLRKEGIKTPILVLIPQVESIKDIIKYKLEPSLYSFYFLEKLISFLNLNKIEKYNCHFKINSGLNRVGFNEFEYIKAINKIVNSGRIKLISLYSHLSASEDLNEKGFTISQINLFKKISSKIKKVLTNIPLLHMSNTSSILNFPEWEFDMVRMGIGLYGYDNGKNLGLQPVHTLRSIISQIIDLRKGESVGYNRAFICKERTKLGIIPLGHADGISRSFAKKLHIHINGHKIKVIGNICMDVLMVDLNGINCDEGDEVVVFDSKNNAQDFAKSVGTISYEILTNLSGRIERKIIR